MVTSVDQHHSKRVFLRFSFLRCGESLYVWKSVNELLFYKIHNAQYTTSECHWQIWYLVCWRLPQHAAWLTFPSSHSWIIKPHLNERTTRRKSSKRTSKFVCQAGRRKIRHSHLSTDLELSIVLQHALERSAYRSEFADIFRRSFSKKKLFGW